MNMYFTLFEMMLPFFFCRNVSECAFDQFVADCFWFFFNKDQGMTEGKLVDTINRMVESILEVDYLETALDGTGQQYVSDLF